MPMQTTITDVPDWLRPYYQQGLEGASTLLMQGGPQQYQGPTVVPFSPQTEQALGMQTQRATAGSPLVGAAQGAAQNIAGGAVNPFTGQGAAAIGGAMGPNTQQNNAARMFGQAGQMNATTGAGVAGLGGFTGAANPYLDQTFNRGAAAIGRNLDSLFARSGRDLGAQAATRGDALGNFASQLYGGAYESDAGRRLAASQALVGAGQNQSQLGLQGASGLAGLGGQIAQQGLAGGQALAGIGQGQVGQQLQAAGMAPTLANQDYVDIAQLRDAGSTVENLAGQYQQDAARRWNFEQARPELALDSFLSRVGMGGQPFSMQQTPMYQNRGIGALGGALLGGSLFGSNNQMSGGGALVGGLLGGFL